MNFLLLKDSWKVVLFQGYVGPGVELTKGCVVGSLCSLMCEGEVPENTVIYGSQHHRRIQAERPAVRVFLGYYIYIKFIGFNNYDVITIVW